jgi:hypothetical protein
MNNDERIAELEAKVAELTRLLTQAQSPAATEVAGTPSSSRRGMLKAAGAAAVGAVAGSVALARPAAAATDEALISGHKNVSQHQTRIGYGLTPNGGPAVNRGDNLDTAGFGTLVVIDANGAPGGRNVAGLQVQAATYAILARAGSSYGGFGDTSNSAVLGFGGSFSFASHETTKANLYLQPNNNLGFDRFPKTQPLQRTDSHLVGEIDNVDGNLWMCVAAGSPGTWKKITGPAAAGSFHAISPSRVYDSRLPAPTPGILATNASRTVSVADKRDTATGAVVTSNVVPAGATAVFVNLTATGTVDGGYLAMNEGGNTTISASAINWSSSGASVANGLVVPLNASRQVTVICGDGSAHFILDVSGYYL